MPKTMPGVFNFERELPESKGPTGGDKVFGLLCVRSVNSSATVHTSLYLHALYAPSIFITWICFSF